MRAARLTALLLFLLAAPGALAAPAAAATPREPFFPRAGNRGYDVAHYGLALTYRRDGGIAASERVLATATERLSGLSLDLYGLEVRSVAVDGVAAAFSRGPGKLRIRPAAPIAPGARFEVAIRYGGRPRALTDPDGTREGWLRTDDGVMALGEPLGTATWMACDDVPADKATFAIDLTVPPRLAGVSNGRLLGVARQRGRRRFRWRESQPMSPYLAVIDVGRGRLLRSRVGALPYWTFVDSRLAARAGGALRALPRVIRFESRLFGGYPFDAAGMIVDYEPRLAYAALETQTRPTYGDVPALTTIVHETAHQWFGDSVGLERWPEIWLNEGFATWTEWYYAERHGGLGARATFRRLYRVPASDRGFWNPPSGRPGSARHLFGTSVYVRGGMALEALRLKIGTGPMLRVLRLWATRNRYGSGDIPRFIDLAEEISGRNLRPLFDRWLYRRGKP